MARDYDTLEGLEGYLREEVLPGLRANLRRAEQLPGLGIVLSRAGGSTRPAVFSAAHLPEGELRHVLRYNVSKLQGVGAILVEVERKRATLRLEHRQLGDVVWAVDLDSDVAELGQARRPPPEERTRFMPARYMN